MRRWSRFIETLGPIRLVAGLGVLLVALAVVRIVLLLSGGGSIVDAALGGLLVGGLGVILLYGGYWLSEIELHRQVYPRVALWSVGGSGALFAVVGVVFVIVNVSQAGGSIDRPLFAVPLAVGLGGVGGLGVGFNEAKAISRAREAERRNRELERTRAELEETVERLETSNERLEQFAYAASHDLQEPLRMVSSYLRLVEERYDEDLDDEGREFIGFAVDGADRMRAMIESLLEYSQVNTAGDPLEPVDANAVLDDVLDDLELRIEETDAAVTTGELPRVRADPDQLAQVFRNLVSNGLTYSGDDPPDLRIGAERTGDRWEFFVSDDGIGIESEFQEQVFDVFNRLHTADEYPGTGIGLALCERIVDRHGGTMRLESRPGEGSTFYFTVPVADEDRTSRPATESFQPS